MRMPRLILCVCLYIVGTPGNEKKLLGTFESGGLMRTVAMRVKETGQGYGLDLFC